MELGSNLVLLLIFVLMSIWMGMNYFRTRNKVVLKDRMWTTGRMMFMIAGLMILATIFLYKTVFDVLRLVAMVACIVFFLLLRDGVGEDGISSMGQFTPYKNVRGYDYIKDKKNRFHVYFTCHDDKSSKNSDYNVNITFYGKDEENVKAYLKERIGKKYIRMKKS